MSVAVQQLSNDDLRLKLLDLGYTPGPIVETTRKLYEKKYASLVHMADDHAEDGLTNGYVELSDLADSVDRAERSPTKRGKDKATTPPRDESFFNRSPGPSPDPHYTSVVDASATLDTSDMNDMRGEVTVRQRSDYVRNASTTYRSVVSPRTATPTNVYGRYDARQTKPLFGATHARTLAEGRPNKGKHYASILLKVVGIGIVLLFFFFLFKHFMGDANILID